MSLKFCHDMSGTISLAEIENSNSNSELASKRLSKFENTPEFPS